MSYTYEDLVKDITALTPEQRQQEVRIELESRYGWVFECKTEAQRRDDYITDLQEHSEGRTLEQIGGSDPAEEEDYDADRVWLVAFD
jgi:chemotaxis regulatin CheY-phosphate phosphatase CheZ